MRTAKEIMVSPVITVSPDTDIPTAAKTLIENTINGMPVVDNTGRIVGILCQSDLIMQQKKLSIPSLFTVLDGFIPLGSLKQLEHDVKKMSALTVADAMTPDPVTVSPNTSMEEVASLIVDKHFHTIPVVENGELVGVIGKEDILKTMLAD